LESLVRQGTAHHTEFDGTLYTKNLKRGGAGDEKIFAEMSYQGRASFREPIGRTEKKRGTSQMGGNG